VNKVLETKIHTLFIIILIFMPKINLVSIDKFYQGIRVEDILILFYSLYILKSYSNTRVIIWNKFFQFKYWIIILYLFSLSILLALINDLKNTWIMVIRAAEYAIIIIYVNNHIEKFQTYINIFKSYIIINFIFSILQYYHLIGSFSSLGYRDSSDILNLRSFGISGGSWEIGALINLSFLILLSGLKNKREVLFYYLLSGVILILANGRANILGFAIISIYLIFFKNYFLKLRNMLTYLLILLTISIIIIYFFDIEKNYYKYYINYFNKMMDDIFFIINSTYNFIINNNVPSFEKATSDNVYSYIYRLLHWKDINNIFQSNNYHYIIGAGSPYLYTESILIRIITSLGLLGALIIICSIRNLKILFVLIFVTMGLTLDLFVSMKIFLFALVFMKINYINESENGLNNRKTN
jgi:hypothetical protein